MEQVVFWAIWAALAVFMGYFYLHHAHGIRSFYGERERVW